MSFVVNGYCFSDLPDHARSPDGCSARHHSPSRFIPFHPDPSQIGVGLTHKVLFVERSAPFNFGNYPILAILAISFVPPPPHVHPISPKVTQSTQESAEGRKPEMMRGANTALVFPITGSPDRQITRCLATRNSKVLMRSHPKPSPDCRGLDVSGYRLA